MRSRRVIFDLLAMLIVGVTLLAMVRAFQPQAAPSGGSGTPIVNSRLFEPERYRDLLVALEAIVYADSADLTSGRQIAGVASALADSLAAREPRFVGTRAHAALFVFAQRFGAALLPAEPLRLDSAQAAWEEVRGIVFRNTYWFQHRQPSSP